jgi:hypothetical protein
MQYVIMARVAAVEAGARSAHPIKEERRSCKRDIVTT